MSMSSHQRRKPFATGWCKTNLKEHFDDVTALMLRKNDVAITNDWCSCKTLRTDDSKRRFSVPCRWSDWKAAEFWDCLSVLEQYGSGHWCPPLQMDWWPSWKDTYNTVALKANTFVTVKKQFLVRFITTLIKLLTSDY